VDLPVIFFDVPIKLLNQQFHLSVREVESDDRVHKQNHHFYEHLEFVREDPKEGNCLEEQEALVDYWAH